MYGVPPPTYVEVKEVVIDSAKFKMDILQSMTNILGFLGLIPDLCLMLTYPSKDRIDWLRRLDP